MDPLTAVGLAGTIIQFVDFTSKILIGTSQLYQHGELSLNAQSAAVVRDLLDFSTKFQQLPHIRDGVEAPTENDLALANLCSECNDVAAELLAKLDRLKPLLDTTGPPRKRDNNGFNALGQRWEEKYEKVRKFGKSLRLALLSVSSREELAAIADRLEKYRTAVQTRMLGSLLERVEILSLKQTKRFDSLDRETKHIVEAVLEDMRFKITKDVRQEISDLAQLFNRRDVVITDKGSGQRVIVDIFQDPVQKHSELFSEDQETERIKEKKLRQSTNDLILESLKFPAMTERHEVLHEAHVRTFQWVFDSSTNVDCQWDDFRMWLEESDGLYWIHGKAGSGKSTLMKYIWNHHLTTTYLSTWAGDFECCTAHFYFWDLGTESLHKSQLGLFRSLLHQILSALPNLLPLVFPEQWATEYAAMSLSSKPKNKPWSLSSLVKSWETLLRIISQGTDNTKLAIFIDGLDEFEGLDGDMARLFSKVAKLPHVKVCAASRPHVVFETAFDSWPSLRLQDLTYNDIKYYIEDRLVNDESVQELATREPVETAKVVDEIIKAADGVFVWVYLAVSSLLRGVGNCDEIQDLQKKLRLLP